MTVITTSYSTIDEAWGDLTGKVKKDKDSNRRKKSPVDPLCELYQSKASQSFNDTDLVRYANEYNDKYRYQRNMKPPPMTYEEQPREPPVKQVVVKRPEQNPSTNNNALFEKQFEIKLPPLYDGGDECPVIAPSVTSEWEPYLAGQHRKNRVVMEEESYHEPMSHEVIQEEEYIPSSSQVQKYVPPPRGENYFDTLDESFGYQEEIKGKYTNMHMLDLILYIVSGIILIFVMEQFVRIGVNMQ
jgi:hypothetical protein